MNDIHACPKCGQRPEIQQIGDAGGLKRYYLNCGNDKCPFKNSTYGFTKGDCIRNWNKVVGRVRIKFIPGENLYTG